jgi:hypothetical protein
VGGVLRAVLLGAIGFRYEVGLGKMDKRILNLLADSFGKMIGEKVGKCGIKRIA